MRFKLIAACIVLGMAMTGCSGESTEIAQTSSTTPPAPARTDVQLDETGLVAAVGSPEFQKYELDDGHGIKFQDGKGPALKLEFRQDRVNIGWEVFSDSSDKLDERDAENLLRVQKALSYAVGDALTQDILDSVKNKKPSKLIAFGHKVNISPGGWHNLVSIDIN